MAVTAAILLAASDVEIDGLPIPLVRWNDDQTLIEFEIAQLQAGGVDVIEVVLGAHADAIIPLVAANDVEPIIDANWHDGEASWLRVGAAAVPRDTTRALIVHAEQPRPAALFRSLVEVPPDGGSIIRAMAAGVAGWPIAVNGAVLAEIRNLNGPLESLVGRHRNATAWIEHAMALAEVRGGEDPLRSWAAFAEG